MGDGKMDLPIIELIEIGKKAFADGDFDRAAECLTAVISHGDQYADLLNIMGVIYHDRGDFNRSIDSFKQALDINPNYLEARLNLAVLYNDLGEYQNARKLYTNLAKIGSGKHRSHDPILDNKMANQHALMGDIYRRLGRFKEGSAEYRKALELGANFADIRTRLGTALRESGDNKGALRELRRALKDKPKYSEARIQLGVTLFTMGRHKDAGKEWMAVLKKDPNNPKAIIYLSMLEDI
jgi:tetratricopeptide (TPR) repeat protein